MVRFFRFLTLLLLGLLISVGLITFTCVGLVTLPPLLFHERNMEQIRSKEIEAQVSEQLQVGMSRSEVESIVNEHAWVQYQCKYTNVSFADISNDIYLFGSHDPELAGILTLQYRLTEGVERLVKIATFESYFLDNNTNGCKEILFP
jgi:hypothetical protein